MKNSFLETIKVLDGEVFNLDFHQKRYESVLSSFGVSEFRDLSLFITPPPLGLYRCRLVYTLENTITTTFHAYKKKTIQSLKIVYDDCIDYALKYEDRKELNKLFEKRGNSDDVLIVKNGLITDTSIANIAFLNGETWVTPKMPLLEGTTRRRLLENAIIIKKDIRVEDLKNFSKVALLNAMIDFDIIANMNYEI